MTILETLQVIKAYIEKDQLQYAWTNYPHKPEVTLLDLVNDTIQRVKALT